MIKGIRKIFSEVADNYEMVNHILTLGLDIHWRHQAAREAVETGGTVWLDVCSGTGEMARYLSRLANSQVKIISLDFCYPMIARAREKNKKGNIDFIEAEAKRLPFPDNCLDLITISFATRNITPNKEYLIDHLREFKRVLRKGGRFINLETSQPSLKLIQQLFRFYIKITVKPIGSFISSSKAGYSYLSYTIPRFFSAQQFSSLLYQAGFTQVSFNKFLFGVAAIHMAVK